MLSPMKLQHIRMIAVLTTLIGAFLFLSMIFVAFSSGTLLTGIVMKMFIVGLVAGGLMVTFGLFLFLRPSIGQLGTS